MKSIMPVAINTLVEAFRRRDIYVLAVICAVFIGFSCFISFWGASGLQRFLTDVSMTVIGISSTIIAVVVTGRQLPSEIEGRRLYPLLAKPISRGEYLCGKFLGCWTISVFSMLFFTLAFLIALKIIGGSVGFTLVQALYTRALMLAIIVSLTLLGSTFLTHSANVTLVLLFCFSSRLAGNAILLMLGKVGALTRMIMQTVYWIIPHLELFDMSKKVVHAWAPIPPWVILTLTAYAAIYVAIFLFLARSIFTRKPL